MPGRKILAAASGSFYRPALDPRSSQIMQYTKKGAWDREILNTGVTPANSFKSRQLDLVILDTAESTWDQTGPQPPKRPAAEEDQHPTAGDMHVISGTLLKPMLSLDTKRLILGSSWQRFARSRFTLH